MNLNIFNLCLNPVSELERVLQENFSGQFASWGLGLAARRRRRRSITAHLRTSVKYFQLLSSARIIFTCWLDIPEIWHVHRLPPSFSMAATENPPLYLWEFRSAVCPLPFLLLTTLPLHLRGALVWSSLNSHTHTLSLLSLLDILSAWQTLSGLPCEHTRQVNSTLDQSEMLRGRKEWGRGEVVCVCVFMNFVCAAASLSYRDRRRGELECLSLRLTDCSCREEDWPGSCSGWNWQWVLSTKKCTQA